MFFIHTSSTYQEPIYGAVSPGGGKRTKDTRAHQPLPGSHKKGAPASTSHPARSRSASLHCKCSPEWCSLGHSAETRYRVPLQSGSPRRNPGSCILGLGDGAQQSLLLAASTSPEESELSRECLLHEAAEGRPG